VRLCVAWKVVQDRKSYTLKDPSLSSSLRNRGATDGPVKEGSV
jgi:hypothetical protein